MTKATTFRELITNYVYKNASSVNEFYKNLTARNDSLSKNKRMNLPSRSTIEGWVFRENLPELIKADINETLAFLPEKTRNTAIELVKKEWAEKNSITAGHPDFKKYIGQQTPLDTILNNFLSSPRSSFTEKKAEDFFDLISDTWKLSAGQVSMAFGQHDHFIAQFRERREENPKKGLHPDTILRFTRRVTNEVLPEELLLSHEGFLNLSSLVNGNRKIGIKEGIPEQGEMAILRYYQNKLTPDSTREDKEKIGHSAYKDVIDFYGLTEVMMQKLLGRGTKATYSRYYSGERKFNNLNYFNDPSLPRELAHAIFVGEDRPTKENTNIKLSPEQLEIKQNAWDNRKKVYDEYANLFVGIKRTYTNEELYQSLVNREISFAQAFFIYRFQTGKTSTEMAAIIGVSKDRYTLIENDDIVPAQKFEVVNFAEKCLGITKEKYADHESRIDELLSLRRINEGKKGEIIYDPEIIKKLESGLENFRRGQGISDHDMHITEGLGNLFKNRNICMSRLKQLCNLGEKTLDNLTKFGTLPDHINKKNKNELLLPLIKELGVPNNEQERFVSVIFEWSHAIKNQEEIKTTYEPLLQDLRTYFDSKHPDSTFQAKTSNSVKKLKDIVHGLQKFANITDGILAKSIGAEKPDSSDMIKLKIYGIISEGVKIDEFVNLLFKPEHREEMKERFEKHSDLTKLRRQPTKMMTYGLQ